MDQLGKRSPNLQNEKRGDENVELTPVPFEVFDHNLLPIK